MSYPHKSLNADSTYSWTLCSDFVVAGSQYVSFVKSAYDISKNELIITNA